ncbi:MAG: efflux RND transporter periplasmic adaptor subunit [Acidobacteriota bacterium]
MKKMFLSAAGAAVLLSSASCGHKARSEAPAERPPVAVEVAALRRVDLPLELQVVGSLEARYAAGIKPDFSGTVTEVRVDQWVPVKKGQLLARLDDREARASLLQAKAEAARADRELERARKLKEAGLMTAQGLEDAETLRETAAAALALAETRLAKTEVRSPMDGVVAERNVSPGDYVENMSGPPMFRIVDNRLFDLTVSVPSSEIHRVAPGQTLRFTTDAVPDRTFEGHVAYVNPAADPASRTVAVRAEVPYAEGLLRSGLFVKGTLLCGVREKVLLLPREALLSWDASSGTAEVFVVEGGRARRTSVRTGESSPGGVEVVSGLAEGAVVVTRGAFNLQDGDRVAEVSP